MADLSKQGDESEWYKPVGDLISIVTPLGRKTLGEGKENKHKINKGANGSPGGLNTIAGVEC